MAGGLRGRDGGARAPPGEQETGAFELALECELPILPITIEGSGLALPKRGFVLQGRHPIRLRVMAPIPPGEFGTRDPQELTDKVRDRIAGALGEPG